MFRRRVLRPDDPAYREENLRNRLVKRCRFGNKKRATRSYFKFKIVKKKDLPGIWTKPRHFSYDAGGGYLVNRWTDENSSLFRFKNQAPADRFRRHKREFGRQNEQY